MSGNDERYKNYIKNNKSKISTTLFLVALCSSFQRSIKTERVKQIPNTLQQNFQLERAIIVRKDELNS